MLSDQYDAPATTQCYNALFVHSKSLFEVNGCQKGYNSKANSLF